MKVKKGGDGKIKYVDINLASPERRNNALETARHDATYMITWRASSSFCPPSGAGKKREFPSSCATNPSTLWSSVSLLDPRKLQF